MCEEIETIAELDFGLRLPMWEMIEQLRKEMDEALRLPEEFFHKSEEVNNGN